MGKIPGTGGSPGTFAPSIPMSTSHNQAKLPLCSGTKFIVYNIFFPKSKLILKAVLSKEQQTWGQRDARRGIASVLQWLHPFSPPQVDIFCHPSPTTV